MIELKHDLILLCEGSHDKLFFSELTSRPGVPKFDIPFPTDRLHGSSAFGGMLTALLGAGQPFQSARGVLLVADSTDDPSKVFGSIRRQIQAAGAFPLPTRLGEVALGNQGFPAIQVATLPEDTRAGCLETLYVEELERSHGGLKTCIEAFLRCDSIEAFRWPIEKADKARFHALAAALHKNNPGRAAPEIFKGRPPLISISAGIFDPVVQRLREFDARARRV